METFILHLYDTIWLLKSYSTQTAVVTAWARNSLLRSLCMEQKHFSMIVWLHLFSQMYALIFCKHFWHHFLRKEIGSNDDRKSFITASMQGMALERLSTLIATSRVLCPISLQTLTYMERRNLSWSCDSILFQKADALFSIKTWSLHVSEKQISIVAINFSYRRFIERPCKILAEYLRQFV